jgi:hypothetical protein
MLEEASAATQRHEVNAITKLPIHVRHDGEVDNEVVNVRKSAKDEVVWYSDEDELTIQFPTTPFSESTFVVPAGGSTSSGPVRADAAIARYPYYIMNVALAKSADPDLIVKP